MNDARKMRIALRLAQLGYGCTSPNPMVGAVLVKQGKIIGRGWHHQAGHPHAEIEALREAESKGHSPRGATLYVTLEPCCTHGRTPPCTAALIAAGIKYVIVGTTDPNPRHAGKGLKILKRAGIAVTTLGGIAGHAVNQSVSAECSRLNEAFNHWIIQRMPFVTVKAAMTLDGKIATARGESKWITGRESRAHGMHLRQGNDAILVGVNTVLADDPSLTVRSTQPQRPAKLRRIILDSMARTPLNAKVVSDENAALTNIIVSRRAPKNRISALSKRVKVLIAPDAAGPKGQDPKLDLRWLLKQLGKEQVTSLLIEGGGEVSSSFLFAGLAQRVAFFYAPKILGGRDSKRAVAGDGAQSRADLLKLTDVEWNTFGPDLFLTARLLK